MANRDDFITKVIITDLESKGYRVELHSLYPERKHLLFNNAGLQVGEPLTDSELQQMCIFTDNSNTKVFQFFWQDGNCFYANGEDVAKAFAASGYGGGAFNALDYYKEIAL